MVWLRSSRLTAPVGGSCQGFDLITIRIVTLGNMLGTEGGPKDHFRSTPRDTEENILEFEHLDYTGFICQWDREDKDGFEVLFI